MCFSNLPQVDTTISIWQVGELRYRVCMVQGCVDSKCLSQHLDLGSLTVESMFLTHKLHMCMCVSHMSLLHVLWNMGNHAYCLLSCKRPVIPMVPPIPPHPLDQMLTIKNTFFSLVFSPHLYSYLNEKNHKLFLKWVLAKYYMLMYFCCLEYQ